MKYLAFALLAVAAAPAAAQQACSIEYQRADNSFAAPGRPDGNLGRETLTLGAGETKVFITDWKYEKQRNDGHNYYGSHLRIIRNSGQHPVKVVLRGGIGSKIPVGGVVTQVIGDRGHGELKPGQSDNNLRADLMEVTCEAREARGGGQTPGGSANATVVSPPTGLMARQVSAYEIQLTWQPVADAKEYRVYVSPPPQPHLAGKPGVVSGTGRSYVIPIPRSNPPAGYSAAIEAVGKDGSVSQRVAFNSVPVQPAGGAQTGGGPASGGPTAGGPTNPPTGPATPGLAGQQCPPGQFVTGFGATGTILCASPPR